MESSTRRVRWDIPLLGWKLWTILPHEEWCVRVVGLMLLWLALAESALPNFLFHIFLLLLFLFVKSVSSILIDLEFMVFKFIVYWVLFCSLHNLWKCLLYRRQFLLRCILEGNFFFYFIFSLIDFLEQLFFGLPLFLCQLPIHVLDISKFFVFLSLSLGQCSEGVSWYSSLTLYHVSIGADDISTS